MGKKMDECLEVCVKSKRRIIRTGGTHKICKVKNEDCE